MYTTCRNITREFLLLYLTVLTSACTTSNIINLEGSNNDTSFSTFEASYRLADKPDMQFKLQTSCLTESFNQSVPDGKIVDLINATGPTLINGNSELRYISLSYGFEGITPGITQYSLINVGFIISDLNLILTHQGTQYNISDYIDDKLNGLYAQIGVLQPVTPSFKAGVTYAVSLGPDLSGINEANIKLSYELIKHLELNSGYRWLKYNQTLDGSDIILRYSGFFIGLGLAF